MVGWVGVRSGGIVVGQDMGSEWQDCGLGDRMGRRRLKEKFGKYFSSF